MTPLAAKTFLGFLWLIGMLCVALFGAAWSFDFWQAWVYIFIFVVSSALVTGYLWSRDPQLLQRRINAGPGAEKEKVQQLIHLLASVAFVSGIVLPALDHRFSWSEVPLPLVIVGEILVMLGIFITFLVCQENTFAGATIEVVPGQQVVSSGPYRLVRHPMYSGALVMMFGTPPALGSWWGLLAFFPMVAIIIWRLFCEEELLTAGLPGYREYCRRVRFRLLPFIW